MFPAAAKSDNFKFGAPPVPSEFTSKQVIFPQNPIQEDAAIHDRNVKTHGNYEAGEQKNRGYNWMSIQPQEHRFGKAEKEAFLNEAAACLNHESLPNQ